ncbi:hypothetical protein ACN47E_009016 [Coniothyrium glycines]
MVHSVLLAKFRQSPAVRLLETIDDVFRRSVDGKILQKQISLERLVDLSTFTETTDHRDTIYALLNLANDINSGPTTSEIRSISPNYRKTVLDVFVEFFLHCRLTTRSLDILCRPWAPSYPSMEHSLPGNEYDPTIPQDYPSWIACRDLLPYGNPAWRLQYRSHGVPLVGDSRRRIYNAHYTTFPCISVGKDDKGNCDGTLFARGIVMGKIGRRSTRLADAIITKECLEILGEVVRKPHSGLIDLPDTIWRTLCADRDGHGYTANSDFRVAMLHLSGEHSHTPPDLEVSTKVLEHMSSIDIVEELANDTLPEHVRQYLRVVRDVIWNRRTFRSRTDDGTEGNLIGLAPQHARIGDHICLLYGCSVPVILRQVTYGDQLQAWKLIGDAFVYGVMEGEAFRTVFKHTMTNEEMEFNIR